MAGCFRRPGPQHERHFTKTGGGRTEQAAEETTEAAAIAESAEPEPFDQQPAGAESPTAGGPAEPGVSPAAGDSSECAEGVRTERREVGLGREGMEGGVENDGCADNDRRDCPGE